MNYTLMTPGPVPVPDEVLKILAMPMEHHRTPEFEKVFQRVLINLKSVFKTKQPVLILTSTGSGAMEASVVNLLSPKDKVICLISGKFGERWAEMCETFGAEVIRMHIPWGNSAEVSEVDHLLQAHPDAKALFCQACETSTAALHPIKEIAQLTRNTSTLFVVDAITAMGAIELPMDEWGIDAIVAGSQKAFMLPTGLSFLALSERAWTATQTAKMPRYYFDVRKELKANMAGESFFSSSVTHIRALDWILQNRMANNLSQLTERIAKLAQATLAAGQTMGIPGFAQSPSPSVSALRMPEGIDGQKVRAIMEEKFKIIVMGGQDQLKGKIVRIGHMGHISDNDLLKTLEALAEAINILRPQTITTETKARALKIAKEILEQK